MTDPDSVLRNFLNTNLSVSGLSTPYADSPIVNPGWYEIQRQKEMQVYLSTGDREFQSVTHHIQQSLDRSKADYGYDATRFVYVAGTTRDQRVTLKAAIKTLFQNTLLSSKYTDVDGNYIEDFIIINNFSMDKDKKKDILAWIEVFEIQLLW